MSFFLFFSVFKNYSTLKKESSQTTKIIFFFSNFQTLFLFVRSLFQVFLCNIKRNDFYQTIFCICLQLLCLWPRKYGASNCFVASYLHFNIQPAYHIVGFVSSCPNVICRVSCIFLQIKGVRTNKQLCISYNKASI